MAEKYILVSQGIKIYETTYKEEAEKIMKIENDAWQKYVDKCVENYEPYADNEIFMFIEEV